MIVSFEEYKKKEKELSEYKNTILKLIDEFIQSDDEFRKNYYNRIGDYRYATDFYEDKLRDRGHRIYYISRFGNTDDFVLTHKEYQRLLKFMEDPDLYRNAKKYNL